MALLELIDFSHKKMAYDSTKVAGDPILSADWNSMISDMQSRAKVSSGSGVPSTTPTMVGELYYDTSSGKWYRAIGTSSSADWKQDVVQT